METLQKLTKIISNFFINDPSAPSVITAWLEDKQTFYTSIVRYTEEYGGGKMVICKAINPDIETGYKELIRQLSTLIQLEGQEDNLKKVNI